MVRYTYILPTLIACIISIFSNNVYGQNESILDFTVKELNGDTLQLRDRLDPNSNYIIETMAFWCGPCIRSIDKFNYHKTYWKERFNVDILLIEDEHWDDLPYIEAEMEDFGWDLDIVVSDDQFSSVGINSIPRYFFKSTASDTVERVNGNIEKFLLERLDSIKFSPVLDLDFKQVTLGEDCEQLVVHKFDANIDFTINGNDYMVINNTPFRESKQNGNIIRFDISKGKDVVHIKYSAALCSRVWLKDLEGDSMLIKILDRYQEDSILHVATDQMLTNECGNDDIPFEFIQNIGTNAGLDFDIEDGRIVSRLICHEEGENIVYMDDELGNMCLSLSENTPQIEDLNIQIFPNPINSKFTISLNFEGEKKIEIFALNGQRLITKTTEQKEEEIQIPTSAQSGLYLVKITTKYGVVTQKVMRIKD